MSAKAKGMKAENMLWHAWLQRDDGLVIDPTADQFNDRKRFEGQVLPLIHWGDSPITGIFKDVDPHVRKSAHSVGCNEFDYERISAAMKRSTPYL